MNTRGKSLKIALKQSQSMPENNEKTQNTRTIVISPLISMTYDLFVFPLIAYKRKKSLTTVVLHIKCYIL